LTEILQLTKQEQWKHCAGPKNPVDLPSRGLSVTELKESTLWWNGPDFIKHEQSTWPTQAEVKLFDDPESKKKSSEENFEDFVATIITNVNSDKTKSTKEKWDFILSTVSIYEHWYKTMKLISYILRMGKRSYKKFQ
jgi:hypothetical protein